jgi:hypothetical protein
MTGLQKLMGWWDKKPAIWWGSPNMALNIIDKARQLLAEEQEAKPTAPASLVEFSNWWFNETIPPTNMTIANKLKETLSRYEAKPTGDDAQARYYNECAKNSTLYDRCCELLSELEKHDPNNPRLEQIEADMEKNGYSLTSLAAEAKEEEPLAELAKRKGKSIDECVIVICEELFQEAEFSSESKARQYLMGLPDRKDK